MELSHRFTVPASADVAWEAFNDLERIAPCFPGASLTSFDGETFAGICKVKLGPVSLQYGGTGRFVERDESSYRAVIEAKGKDKRGNGTAAATITAQLTSAGDETTDVVVSTDLNVTGRPAQFGRGVMQDVSDKLLAQFASCLETKLAEQGGNAPPAEAEPQSPTEAEPEPAAEAKPQPGVEPPPPSEAEPQHRGDSSSVNTELNLVAAVVPALLKRYAPYAAGAAAGVAGLWLLRKLFRR